MTRVPRPICFALAGCVLSSLMATTAAAHGDHGASTSPFLDGLLHPLTGWDHLLVIILTGAFAACLRGRSQLAVPAVFTTMMLAGFVAMRFLAPFAPLESMIMLSLFGMAALLFVPDRVGGTAVLFVGAFGTIHGMAHGVEAPSLGALPFAIGMVTATGLLQLVAFAGSRGVRSNLARLSRHIT